MEIDVAVYTSPDRTKRLRMDPNSTSDNKAATIIAKKVEDTSSTIPHSEPVDPLQQSEKVLVGALLDGQYRVLDVLGHGNFSTVYLAENTHFDKSSTSDIAVSPHHPPTSCPSHPRLVAIKRVHSPLLNPMSVDEFALLKSLHSGFSKPRHIIEPLSAFLDIEGIHHTIFESLNSMRPICLPEQCTCPAHQPRCSSLLACPTRQYKFQKLIQQLLVGMNALHEAGIIHADLNPENVLYVPEKERLKIIDLGNAIRWEQREEYEGEWEIQSAHYRAPEILLGAGPVGGGMDVWSAGVLGLQWFLGHQGRRELEAEVRLMDGRDVDVDCGGERPVMHVETKTRFAVVSRVVKLFGDVRCYDKGTFWRGEYGRLSRVSWGVAVGGQGSGGAIVEAFLRGKEAGGGVVGLLGGMLKVDVRERWEVGRCLRDGWLVEGLLGEWGRLLIGGGGAAEGGHAVRGYLPTRDDSGIEIAAPGREDLQQQGHEKLSRTLLRENDGASEERTDLDAQTTTVYTAHQYPHPTPAPSITPSQKSPTIHTNKTNTHESGNPMNGKKRNRNINNDTYELKRRRSSEIRRFTEVADSPVVRSVEEGHKKGWGEFFFRRKGRIVLDGEMVDACAEEALKGDILPQRPSHPPLHPPLEFDPEETLVEPLQYHQQEHVWKHQEAQEKQERGEKDDEGGYGDEADKQQISPRMLNQWHMDMSVGLREGEVYEDEDDDEVQLL